MYVRIYQLKWLNKVETFWANVTIYDGYSPCQDSEILEYLDGYIKGSTIFKTNKNKATFDFVASPDAWQRGFRIIVYATRDGRWNVFKTKRTENF